MAKSTQPAIIKKVKKVATKPQRNQFRRYSLGSNIEARARATYLTVIRTKATKEDRNKVKPKTANRKFQNMLFSFFNPDF